jgi:hypothetical protein
MGKRDETLSPRFYNGDSGKGTESMKRHVVSGDPHSDGVQRRDSRSLSRISRAPRVAYCSTVNLLYQEGFLNARRLNLPHFLGIGAQKAGSTWLYENLRRHPDVFLPDTKDLKYFSRRFHVSLRDYSRNFAAGNGRVVGDICTSYSILQPSRIRFIKRTMPEIRVLVVLRNPIERAWSIANMQLVRDRGREVQDVTESEFIRHFESESSRRHGDYRALLERWFSVFPEEHVWIGFFDEIVEEPKTFLLSVFEFLGVRTNVNWDSFPYRSVFNASTQAPIPEPLRAILKEMYEPSLDWVCERFGDRVRHWMVD